MGQRHPGKLNVLQITLHLFHHRIGIKVAQTGFLCVQFLKRLTSCGMGGFDPVDTIGRFVGTSLYFANQQPGVDATNFCRLHFLLEYGLDFPWMARTLETAPACQYQTREQTDCSGLQVEIWG